MYHQAIQITSRILFLWIHCNDFLFCRKLFCIKSLSKDSNYKATENHFYPWHIWFMFSLFPTNLKRDSSPRHLQLLKHGRKSRYSIEYGALIWNI